jgi:glycosyltransferase involved in cell wall biosynthesis
MRIAQVAPMYEAVPPHRYGGTERVVSYLTEELVRRGHQVTLFASGDSKTRARLVATTERALRERFTLQEMETVAIPLHLAMLSEVLQHAGDFDIIHCHNDYWVFPFEPFVATPVVTTLHGRLDLSHLPPILERFPRANLVSISYHQRAPFAALRPHWVGMVYNAVPVEEFPFSDTPGDYLLFLGRISPEKRVDWAIEIAKRTGMKLKIAAKIDVYDRSYFEREIEGLLDHPLIEFLGEVGESEKRELLAGAYALAFPIDWPEPFGMVLIESMACGTPVLAMSRGSVPEVLRQGISGLVGNSIDELVALAPQIGHLDRRACRAEAERRFSARVMADSYEQIYHRAIAERQSEELARALGAGVQRVPTSVRGI